MRRVKRAERLKRRESCRLSTDFNPVISQDTLVPEAFLVRMATREISVKHFLMFAPVLKFCSVKYAKENRNMSNYGSKAFV